VAGNCRTLSEPGGSGTDLRRALGHAQAAFDERRRWSGPSADALTGMLDILTTAGDMTAVITAALPESEAGAALDAEATEPGVARRARARAGEPDVGIARLRQLAEKSLLAAGEMVQLLDEDTGPGAAISDAEQQITRWQAPSLR
jgi:hypothetical protein